MIVSGNKGGRTFGIPTSNFHKFPLFFLTLSKQLIYIVIGILKDYENNF